MKRLSPDELIDRSGIISDQVNRRELRVILTELKKLLDSDVAGNVVEFGCYAGTTSLYIRRLLDQQAVTADREFHVYDSFAGLPEKTLADRSPAGEQFIAGELAVSKKDFLMNFRKAGLGAPYVHKAWFDQLSDNDVPERICFAFLDGDYYDSIAVSLKLIEKKLVPDAVIIVDDYSNEALPGAAIALDRWLARRPNVKLQTIASLAVISFV